MRLTKRAAKYAGGWDCFREGCTIAQLRSNLSRKSLAKQNQQNISHIEPWQQKNMFLTPDLIQICLGEFFSYKFAWGNSWDTRQGKEAWFASSAEKEPQTAKEQISSLKSYSPKLYSARLRLIVETRWEVPKTRFWKASFETSKIASTRSPQKGDNDNFCLHLWEL